MQQPKSIVLERQHQSRLSCLQPQLEQKRNYPTKSVLDILQAYQIDLICWRVLWKIPQHVLDAPKGILNITRAAALVRRQRHVRQQSAEAVLSNLKSGRRTAVE